MTRSEFEEEVLKHWLFTTSSNPKLRKLDMGACGIDAVLEAIARILERKYYIGKPVETTISLIKRVAMNKTIDWWRTSQFTTSENTVDRSSLCTEQPLYHFILHDLTKILDNLYPKRRDLLYSSLVEGATTQELAQQYHLQVSSVRSILSRAMPNIRRRMKKAGWSLEDIVTYRKSGISLSARLQEWDE